MVSIKMILETLLVTWQGKYGKWRILVGSFKSDRGLAVLCRSDDLKSGVCMIIPFIQKQSIWECSGRTRGGARGCQSSLTRKKQCNFFLQPLLNYRDQYNFLQLPLNYKYHKQGLAFQISRYDILIDSLINCYSLICLNLL